MTKRSLTWTACAAVVALALAALLGSGFPQLLFALWFASLDPESIDWDSKIAWEKCVSAISGTTRWPKTNSGACEAMHMCANEAPLDAGQAATLRALVGATPNCPKF
jgi:hypothetical protein